MEREHDRNTDRPEHEHDMSYGEQGGTEPQHNIDQGGQSGRTEHQPEADQPQHGQTGQKRDRRQRKGGGQNGRSENKGMERKAG